MAKSKPVGRPPEAVPARLAAALFEHLAAGRTLREFCAQRGRPAVRTIHDWRRDDPAFAAAYTKAREVGADVLADEVLAIADELPAAGAVLDAAFVARQRLRVDARLRLLAKWFPVTYGDKTQLHHEGSISVQVVTGVPQIETDQPAAPPAALPAAMAPVLQINTGFTLRAE